MVDVASSGQLHEFLRVLRRRRWQIVMPAIFVLALGTVFAVVVPKKYVITTRVELLEGRRAESDPALKNRSGSAVQREVENVAHHLANYTRIQDVVSDQAGLWVEYVTADAEGRRDIIERIQDNLEVVQVEKRRNEGSTFVDIEYRDIDGERAVKFLEDLIDKWVREVVESDEINIQNELETFRDEADKALLEKREAARDYSALAKEMGVSPDLLLRPTNDAQADPIFAQIENIEVELQGIRQQLASAEETYKVAAQLRKEAPEFVPANIELDLFEARERAQTAIDELELQKVGKLETHSKYIEAEREIVKIRELLAEEEEKILRDPPKVPNEDLKELLQTENMAKLELKRLEAEEKQLLAQWDDRTAERNRRIDSMNELLDLKGLLDEKNRNWETASAYLREKNIALSQIQAYPEPYQITRPPEVDGAPTEPNTILLVLLAAFAGLALGLSLALAAEYARNSYRTVADVAQVMTIPVLGTVDQIVTSIESRRTQARRAVVGLSSAVILGGLAWFTWIWADTPDKLPMGVRNAIEQFRLLLM